MFMIFKAICIQCQLNCSLSCLNYRPTYNLDADYRLVSSEIAKHHKNSVNFISIINRSHVKFCCGYLRARILLWVTRSTFFKRYDPASKSGGLHFSCTVHSKPDYNAVLLYRGMLLQGGGGTSANNRSNQTACKTPLWFPPASTELWLMPPLISLQQWTRLETVHKTTYRNEIQTLHWTTSWII